VCPGSCHPSIGRLAHPFVYLLKNDNFDSHPEEGRQGGSVLNDYLSEWNDGRWEMGSADGDSDDGNAFLDSNPISVPLIANNCAFPKEDKWKWRDG